MGCISPLASLNLCITALLAWLVGNVSGDRIHGGGPEFLSLVLHIHSPLVRVAPPLLSASCASTLSSPAPSHLHGHPIPTSTRSSPPRRISNAIPIAPLRRAPDPCHTSVAVPIPHPCQTHRPRPSKPSHLRIHSPPIPVPIARLHVEPVVPGRHAGPMAGQHPPPPAASPTATP